MRDREHFFANGRGGWLWVAARLALVVALALSGCQGLAAPPPSAAVEEATPVSAAPSPAVTDTSAWVMPTAYPTRPVYSPGELVDYEAQAGDTLDVLALRFNTAVDEILAANTFIPASATTMPPGMPMKIPIYYVPLWGSPYKILPDSLFINGPAQIGFDTAAFVAGQPGWLKDYQEYAFGGTRSAAQLVDYVAKQYSVSPRLLLALLEYQAGALTQPERPESTMYLLGNVDWRHKGMYQQLIWAANALNNGYYDWRGGKMLEFEYLSGRLERPDPWLNAATVALHYYFAQLLDGADYERAIAQDGFAQAYGALFGDPWQADAPHIPGSLAQPEFELPFAPGRAWAYTGGPHTGYGDGAPFAALDFAPGAKETGCVPTDAWATAVAAGVVARSEYGMVVLDLDGDGDERTGWTVLYLHIGSEGRVAEGAVLNAGDLLGHPSCEGGRTTGTHVHIARKYNGEWVLAEGTLAFNMDGWTARNGAVAYQGFLQRGGRIITACECADAGSHIEAGK